MAASRGRGAGVARQPSETPADQHVWSFLSNYAHVLVSIARDPDLTLREMADLVGITERAVHRIVGELETAGVVQRVKEGRRNHYELDLSSPMRHPLEGDKTVGDLLAAMLEPEAAAALGLGKKRRR